MFLKNGCLIWQNDLKQTIFPHQPNMTESYKMIFSWVKSDIFSMHWKNSQFEKLSLILTLEICEGLFLHALLYHY